MTLFRNPIVVVCLALVALLLLGRSLSPLWKHGRPSAPNPPAPTPAQAALPPAPAPVVSNAPAPTMVKPQAEAAPEQALDLARVGWEKNGAPRRDPFQMISPGLVDLARLYPPVSELMLLSAIWRQTDSSLAMINHKIVGEGDTVVTSVENRNPGGAPMVVRFTVESIRANSVWLQGPAGREELEFPSLLSGPKDRPNLR